MPGSKKKQKALGTNPRCGLSDKAGLNSNNNDNKKEVSLSGIQRCYKTHRHPSGLPATTTTTTTITTTTTTTYAATIATTATILSSILEFIGIGHYYF